MQALVLIAHGSRRQASNTEVTNLVSGLKQTGRDRYQIIEAGFLEIATPSIPEAVESCIEYGATSVVIVPYFLAAGRHVTEDIPRIVKLITEQHRGVNIHVAEHIGVAGSMNQLILDSAGGVHKQAGLYRAGELISNIPDRL